MALRIFVAQSGFEIRHTQNFNGMCHYVSDPDPEKEEAIKHLHVNKGSMERNCLFHNGSCQLVLLQVSAEPNGSCQNQKYSLISEIFGAQCFRFEPGKRPG